VTALYQARASGLIRLAVIVRGDRPVAEDVVQDAFLGLYRNFGLYRNWVPAGNSACSVLAPSGRRRTPFPATPVSTRLAACSV
jgi:hypothetical protein